jgi:putative spermidine/putrescine transport system ATP-binding protein
MSNSGSRVEFRGVTRQFGSVQALQEFNLTIEPGELVTLLGPSGCGKTTALRILAGIDQNHSGEIYLDGELINNTPANKRHMGMVFQAYSLFPNMSAKENVEYGLKIRGVGSSERAKKSLELLELVGLGRMAKRRPNQLSGGQQQRVARARALAIEPRVLLLDEPLSALDAQVRTQLRDEISRIQKELKITTLFVTHDQEEAMAISDRVAVMNQGEMIQIDVPQKLYNKPKSSFVAGFVGSTNAIPAVMHSSHEVMVLGQILELSEHSGAFKKNEEVRALIRPEYLSIERADQENKSTIITKSFLGAVTRIGIDAGLDQLIYCEMTSKDARKYELGERVKIEIHSDSVMVSHV